MMIRYLPPSAWFAKDMISFDYAIKNLVNYARLQFNPIRPAGLPTCQACGQVGGRIEIHHIKPLWAYAIEAIIRLDPKSMDDMRRITSMAYLGQIDICAGNDPSNLRRLCRSCHEKAETEADAWWKRRFRLFSVMFTKKEQWECYMRYPSS